MSRSAAPLPAVLRFPPAAGRVEAWGKLLRLTAGGAELTTGTRLVQGEEVLLSFELGGEACDDLRALVTRAEDDDGHRRAELRFLDAAQRRRLAKTLTEVLSR